MTRKHIKPFNEAKRLRSTEVKFDGSYYTGGKCARCGEKSEMYYEQYCPKCDIQSIIKHKKGAYCLMPILSYGEKFINGFDRDDIWHNICESLGGNDTYLNYEIDEESEDDLKFKECLDELSVKPDEDGEYFFWVSW